jgi:hypothetical protein
VSSLPGVEREDPVEGGRMDAEGASDVADRFTLLKQPLGEIPLLGIHLFRPSEADASPSCVRATGTGALADEVTFELCDTGEYGHDHLARVSGGIGPWLGEGLESCAGITDCFDDFQEVASGAGQSVELPYGDDVSVAKLVEHPVQLRPVSIRSGNFFTKDAFAAGLLQSFELNIQALILGGHASVADFHLTVPILRKIYSNGNGFCEILLRRAVG